MREGGRGGESRRRGRARRLLIVGEMALAATLVASAFLLVRSMRALDGVDPGFDPDGVLTARIALPTLAYPDVAAQAGFEQRFIDRIAGLPGVEAVGLASALPSQGDSWSSDFSVEGRADELYGVNVVHREVSPGYFPAMRVPLVRGRSFAESDDANAPAVALINRTLAERFFKGVDPIGLRICFDRKPDANSYWRTIVGIVGDERQDSRSRPARPEIFAPMALEPDLAPRIVVRSALAPSVLTRELRAALAELDPRLPLFEVHEMTELVARSRGRERFVLSLFGAFALLALVLAAIGVYGVTAHAAAGRRREIGVRIALGAAPARVVRDLVRGGVRPVVAGLAIGTGGALLLGRALASQLYGVGPSDPVSLIAAPLLLWLFAVTAIWLPARRASRLAPAEVLRAD